jgi:hypothetical protein
LNEMPRASIHHFALILFVSLGRVAAAADPTRATVASGDTSVQIEAQADKLKLIGCKSLLADWNWTTGSAIPLLNFVVVEGQDPCSLEIQNPQIFQGFRRRS